MKNFKLVSLISLSLFVISPKIVAYDVPDTIRIGLESVAKDTSRVKITSEEDLAIGYYIGDRWYEEGTLDTEEVNIALASEVYYTYTESYRTYDDAYDELTSYEEGAVVAFVQPGEYRIYSTEDGKDMEEVGRNSSRMEVYDDKNNVILVTENEREALSFQGTYDDYDFPATGVGNERIYRGAVEVVEGQYRGVTAVSVLEFEDYLYGVVNNEMGGLNPTEALKAQAVAARSMATFQYGRYNDRGYHLVDTTATQVYKGILSEHDNTTDAVDATRGEVVTYNGKVAETVYSASSGGHTENVQHVWGSQVDYLVGVPDIYEENNHDWTRTISLEEIERSLRNDGIDIGDVEGMEIVDWTASGRVEELRILGTDGYHTLTREMPRNFFHDSDGGALKSTMFKFTPYEEDRARTMPVQTLSPMSNTFETKDAEAIDREDVFVLGSKDALVAPLSGLHVESSEESTILGENDGIYIATSEGIVVTHNETMDEEDKDELVDSDNDDDDKDHVTDTEEEDEEDKPTGDGGGSYLPFDPSGEKRVVYGDVTLYGKGYGHGVGMSQNGAISMARNGYKYDEILEHYYTGAEIE